MVLGGTNTIVDALHAFWFRKSPIWEGHTPPREACSPCRSPYGPFRKSELVAEGWLTFVVGVTTGFAVQLRQPVHG